MPDSDAIVYVISDPVSSLVLDPQFAVTPSFCDAGRTQENPANCGATCDPIVYDDGPSQTVNVGPTNNLAPADPNNNKDPETDVTVPIVQKTCDYFGNCKDTPAPIPVTIKNPCVDPSYVDIVAPALKPEDYIVSSGPETFTPAHSDFTVDVKNVGFDWTQCGDLTIVATYDGTDLPFVNSPLTYEASTDNTFIFESDDQSLIGTNKIYGLKASFTDYPVSTGADTASVIDVITFINPCLNPFTFDATTQDRPAANEYDSQVIDWTFTEFDVSPSYC